MNPYKWLWSRVGGRPWTFILRDFYHQFEYFILLIPLLLGYYVQPYLCARDLWIIIGALTIGYVCGHLFWGKKYIEGQEGL